MKLIWIFIKNVLRSVATAVIVAVVAVFLTGLILLLWDFLAGLLNSIAVELFKKEAFAHEMNLIEMLVVNFVVGLVLSFFWMLIGDIHDWFFNGKVDCMKHPPHTFFGILVIMIVPFAIAGVAIWMSITGYDAMYALLEKNSGTDNLSFFEFLPMIIPAVAASQIVYGIKITKHYSAWQRCKECKRMFCFEYGYTGSKSWSKTTYKTKTEKEKVGALYSGDTKIMDVEGNVTRTYADTMHFSIDNYKGTCVHCGAVKNNSADG